MRHLTYKSVLRALTLRFWLAYGRTFFRVKCPLSFLFYYLFKIDEGFPRTFVFRTPVGIVPLKAFSVEDVITMFIVFCRNEYNALPAHKLFVDFGANIGISAAFFLSRSKDSYVYLFEPNPLNVHRLRDNLKQFDQRFSLEEVAIDTSNGSIEFGTESTGIYGGISRRFTNGSTIVVKTRDVNEVLTNILNLHQKIDFLKIDIEEKEREILPHIRTGILEKVNEIDVETWDFTIQIPGFQRNCYGFILRFKRENV